MKSKLPITSVAGAVALVALTTLVYGLLLPVNPTTVALTLLVAVLITAAFSGFRTAIVTAVVATATLNFFFLPPLHTFTIADPQNWIALVAFLVTALVASNLAERARREAAQASQRRYEVERLYALSERLLTSDSTSSLLNSIPTDVATVFSLDGVALTLSTSSQLYLSKPELQFDADLLRMSGIAGEPRVADATTYIPLRTGVRPVGALAMVGSRVSRETADAIGSLVGLSVERARALEELAVTRASQENDRLRSALLDSIAHEIRTPLTGIKASITALLDANILEDAEKKELLTVIDEESDRLNRLVEEASEMAQLDAGMFVLETSEHSVAELVEAAIASERVALQQHDLCVEVSTDLRARFDFGRIREVLIHLLGNAAKYSDPGARITVSAVRTGNELVISVADHGIGIDSHEQALIFDRFYRGPRQKLLARGTGMGLAICKAIVEAHGGKIEVTSQVSHGSVFSIRLPAE